MVLCFALYCGSADLIGGFQLVSYDAYIDYMSVYSPNTLICSIVDRSVLCEKVLSLADSRSS